MGGKRDAPEYAVPNMSFNITIDSKSVLDMLSNSNKKFNSLLSKSLDATVAFGLREIKSGLPKRTGNLRGSYQQRPVSGVLRRTIFSDLQYAVANEEGAKAHTIVPKRAKMLLIPLREDVLTGTRSQIKKSSVDRLFNQLKKKKGRSNRQIFDEVGIALAKKANIPAIKGNHKIRDVFLPKIATKLEREVLSALREYA